jgi:hypothetical protein
MPAKPLVAVDSPRETPPKPKKHKPVLKFRLWPIIATELDARWAAKQGAGAAVFCAIATAVVAVWSHYSTDMARQSGLNVLALLDALLFAAVAIGLYLNSRIAAVAGLVLYALERLSVPVEANLKAIVMVALLVLCFISGVRGTFSLHRFRREARNQPGAPIVP